MGYYWPADVFSDDVVMIKTFGAGMSKISESTTLATQTNIDPNHCVRKQHPQKRHTLKVVARETRR